MFQTIDPMNWRLKKIEISDGKLKIYIQYFRECNVIDFEHVWARFFSFDKLTISWREWSLIEG